MATNPYESQSVPTTYNLSPPPNDGTQSPSNLIDWALTIVAKIGDPLKAFGQNINSATRSAFGKTINTDPDEQNTLQGSLAFSPTELTIATGAISATRSSHTVDTEANAATDDLDTIEVTSFPNEGLLLLRAANAARTVVVKDNTGNVQLDGGADFTMDDDEKTIVLQRRGASFYEVARSVSSVQAGQIVQQVVATSTTEVSTATNIPADNTIPQNTEGDELFDQAFTPQFSSSKILVSITALYGTSGGGALAVTLFVDSETDATFAGVLGSPSTGSLFENGRVDWIVDASSTTERNYKVRYGVPSGTAYINRSAATADLYGADKLQAVLTITEIAQ